MQSDAPFACDDTSAQSFACCGISGLQVKKFLSTLLTAGTSAMPLPAIYRGCSRDDNSRKAVLGCSYKAQAVAHGFLRDTPEFNMNLCPDLAARGKATTASPVGTATPSRQFRPLRSQALCPEIDG